MSWHYAYSPFIWPMLASALVLAGLGVYGWRHRSVPGALPFAFLMFLPIPWALGAVAKVAATDIATKIFWIKLEPLWLMPVANASLWFAVEYANLGRWFSRRTLALLAIPALLLPPLLFTNGIHHLIWQNDSADGDIRPVLGVLSPFLMGYGLLLLFATSLIFLWLFWRSPLHRWPAALCLCGQIAVRGAFLLDRARPNLIGPVDLTVLASCFAGSMYALALFRFRLFDLVPVARGTVIEQMHEGMLILDREQRVIDVNPAAERILGISAKAVRGTNANRLFPACSGARPDLCVDESEITLPGKGGTREYELHLSPLKDRRGFQLGHVVLLYDVSQQKQAQGQVLEQQRALATLQERDHIARELHDSLGQVLGYVKMQAQAVRKLLALGRTAEADGYLAKLAAAAQDAHSDVREFILASRSHVSADSAFIPVLEQYLQRFSDQYGIATALHVPPELTAAAFEPTVAAQLLRVIQESLTNVRKHAGARRATVSFAVSDSRAETVIQDDGTGFDPARLGADEGRGYGLSFMRERAEEVGGSIRIDSAPGEGTRVTISMPLRKERL
jgi:PAS domain S-box-containing protein